jgi:hypothetical protein
MDLSCSPDILVKVMTGGVARSLPSVAQDRLGVSKGEVKQRCGTRLQLSVTTGIPEISGNFGKAPAHSDRIEEQILEKLVRSSGDPGRVQLLS